MKYHKISIIIPAYNEQDYIKSCIDSILANDQKYIHEIILVDNASTDKTAEIVKKYDNIKYVFEWNKWLTRARQAGYKTSTWDILAYVDADSKVPKNWVEKIYNHFKNDDKLIFLSGPYVYYDMNLVQKFFIWIYRIFGGYISYLFTWYLGVWWNMIMKKSMLDEIWWFDTEIEFYGEDTNIARRASAVWKCKFDLKFINYTSARRLKKQWWMDTWYIYIKNFISQVMFKKSADSDYKDWR